MRPFEVINHEFPKNQYYQYQTEKNQIVLHHTSSGNSVQGDIDWWKQTKERVATCVLIDREGVMHTLFSSKYWAHHLGIKIKVFDQNNIKRIFRKNVVNGKMYVANNVILNESSVGVELDNWGGLQKVNNKFYSWTNKRVHSVIDYGISINGFRYYEKYTEKQLETLDYLLKYWNRTYNIPLDYNQDMWAVSQKALNGDPGIWTHVSYRKDKSDCHPQKELIQTIKSL